MTAKRLYRVVGTFYVDRANQRGVYTSTYHYQTKKAAEGRAAYMRGGRGLGWDYGTDTVRIDVSDPVTFPVDVVPEGPPQDEVLPLDVVLDPGGCGTGKHTACSGTAWDDGNDEPTGCPCCAGDHR